MFVVCYLLVVGCWMLVDCCSLCAVGCCLVVRCCLLLFVMCCLSFVVRCSLLAGGCRSLCVVRRLTYRLFVVVRCCV